MSIHFLLDFATPFGIGDQVYVLHPPKEVPCPGGSSWPPYRKGTIAQVKLVLDLNPGNGLVITQPTDQKTLQVERVIYTVICPPTDHHQAAFTVECPTCSGSERKLFISEEEVKAHLLEAVA